MSPTMTGTVANGVIIPSVPLPEGAKVEFVVIAERPVPAFASALEFLESLPAVGPRAFETWEEYEQHLEAEKD
jgi:hypothetical protein